MIGALPRAMSMDGMFAIIGMLQELVVMWVLTDLLPQRIGGGDHPTMPDQRHHRNTHG